MIFAEECGSQNWWCPAQVLYSMRFQATNAQLEAWTCSVLGLLYLLAPFIFCETFGRALFLAVFTNAISSVTFSFQFVVNHEVDKPGVMDGPPPAEIDWGHYQVWRVDSRMHCLWSRLDG